MIHRLGLHVMSPDRDDLVRTYIDRARPTLMKWLDDPGGNDIVAYARERGALTVLRVFEEHQSLAGTASHRFIGRVVAAMRQWPAMAVAEGYNEEFQDASEAADRADFDIALMQAMDGIGRKAAIFSGSTGTPEDDFWPGYLPALVYAAEHGHYVAVHTYGGGPIGQKWGVGRNQWNDGNPTTDDDCERPGLLGWWAFRHRRMVAEWRRLGLTTIPRIIGTEGGLDDIDPRPGHGGKGYKNYVGEHPATVGDYAAQWAWFMRWASQDEYFAGACDFGFATRDPQWSSFDMSTDVVTLERVMVEMGRLAATPAPPPPPPEVTMIEGIDVARYQGTVDWRKAAAAGARFAWCKATEGTSWIDPRFHDNARGAKDAGILVGAYHYYRNELDPRAQAHHLAAVCAQHQLTLPPALDFEDTASPADPAAMRAFCEEVGRLMGRPVIYTASWWWTRSRLGGAQPWASAYPLWVADYEGAVALPGDWSDWTVHQFTSSGHGPTYGAESARIDRNRYRGTLDQLAALRQAVATELDVAALVAAAEAEHQERGVRFNPGAGIQRAILADGYVPTTNERDHDDASGHYVYQRAERLAGGEPRVYVWDPRAGAVRWVPGGAA